MFSRSSVRIWSKNRSWHAASVRIVLDAMRKVPREAFLPENLREFAYEDAPLPIEAGQTISQPYIVALMTEALELEGGEKVLEIGTGSGYAAAVLAEIAGEVYTVERIGQLAQKAAATLADLGYAQRARAARRRHARLARARPLRRDHRRGRRPEVPQSLKEQLKIGGRLVIPVGTDPRVSGASACYAGFRSTNSSARISPMSASFR